MALIREFPIRRCRSSEDVAPFSECRNNLAADIFRVKKTHRPILVTRNGHPASYPVNAEDLDNLLDAVELSREIEISRRECTEGKGVPNERIMQATRERLRRRIEQRKSDR